MKIHHEIIQGTEEWFRIKWGKVGGSTSKQLFTKTDTLLISIVAELAEPFELDEDSYVSSDMQRGIELEPLARGELSKYIGAELFNYGWVASTENPLLGISPDGLTPDGVIGAEIKCLARDKHTRTVLEDVIPSDYIHQCLHYFTVMDTLREFYFASFRPESIKPLFVKRLTRESLIDLGTKAKPQIKTVDAWVTEAKINAENLAKDANQKLESLKF